MPSNDVPMWMVVMFDLPVKEAVQRRAASAFRLHLLDLGFLMTQLSVYSRYSPTSAGMASAAGSIRDHLPDGGEVRIFRLSDLQWSQAQRFSNGEPADPGDAPDDFTLF